MQRALVAAGLATALAAKPTAERQKPGLKGRERSEQEDRSPSLRSTWSVVIPSAVFRRTLSVEFLASRICFFRLLLRLSVTSALPVWAMD